MPAMLTPDMLRPLIKREIQGHLGMDESGNVVNNDVWGRVFARFGANKQGRGFGSLFGRDNQTEHAYGKLAASTTQSVAAAGAFTTGSFTLQKSVSDAVLYLSDDGKQVQDITSVTFGGETYTLSGALAGSAFRDDASLGGPNKGLYLGDVDTSQIVSIAGNVKNVAGNAVFTTAIFSFYVVGKFKGKGCACNYGNQP